MCCMFVLCLSIHTQWEKGTFASLAVGWCRWFGLIQFGSVCNSDCVYVGDRLGISGCYK